MMLYFRPLGLQVTLHVFKLLPSVASGIDIAGPERPRNPIPATSKHQNTTQMCVCLTILLTDTWFRVDQGPELSGEPVGLN